MTERERDRAEKREKQMDGKRWVYERERYKNKRDRERWNTNIYI